MTQRIALVVGMQVRLRKLHPCGNDEWTITRAGADVGIVCIGCGRRVLLEREEFERRVRHIVPQSAASGTEKEQA
jgi:hypothetical protein